MHRWRRAPTLPLDPLAVLSHERADPLRRGARRHHDLHAAIAEHAHAQTTRTRTLPHRPGGLDPRAVQELQLSHHVGEHDPA